MVEFEAIGPVPYAVMLLADHGADVIRVERPDAPWPQLPIVSRGRADLPLDLKRDEDRATAREALLHADVVVEGFRPGVMERLGLGPELMLAANPRLIYARMTGWGQHGPLAQMAGHDINYLAVSGLLSLLGRDESPPVAPLNLLGDYAGGSLFLVMGILAALFERERSGAGQVIDAAIVDGAASLLAPILGMQAAGLLGADPRSSMLSGRAAYYRVYRCADGRDLAVGALEPHFRRIVTARLALEPGALDDGIAGAAERLSAIFASRPRAHWQALFEGTDACVSPVLSVDEAASDPLLANRAIYAAGEHGAEPVAAPRFSRSSHDRPAEADGRERLAAWMASKAR